MNIICYQDQLTISWKTSIALLTNMEITVQYGMQRLLVLWTPIANPYTIIIVTIRFLTFAHTDLTMGTVQRHAFMRNKVFHITKIKQSINYIGRLCPFIKQSIAISSIHTVVNIQAANVMVLKSVDKPVFVLALRGARYTVTV